MKYRHLFTPETVSPSYRTYRSGRILMRIDFFRHMLRVALLRDGERLLPGYHICPDGVSCPVSGRDRLSVEGLEPACPEVTEEGGTVRFTLDGVRFTVELLNFRITAENERGLLYRDRGGLAYNFAHELGDGSAHFTDRFPDQRIFGLGDKCGHVNKTGRSFVLGAGDAMGFRAECSDPLYKYFPFYICAHAAGSYGLFYDTHSLGRFNFGEEHDNYFEPFNSARFEEENLVFYLFTGSVREIIRRFSRLTGTAAPVPEWAFRYCGSTMDYTDAPDADRRLRGFLEQCDGCGIRPGGFYLSSGYTSIGEKRCVFHWNRKKIPDPAGLSAHFRAHGEELVANVKPAFLTDHPLYPRIAKHGWFLYDRDRKPALFPFWGGFASLLDFTNPGAYDFWKCCVKEHLVSYGIRSIWNDNNEYTIQDREILAFGFGQEVPARLIRPVFPYLMARASREACEEALRESFAAGVPSGTPGCVPSPEPLFMVSRCAMPGTRRVATTWTGDNLTDFRDLRYNHCQAMTMALSGFLFFGPDIGGFAGPKPDKELFLRWIQYGVFLPRFVLHSWKPGEEPTMPWLYPDLLPVVKRLFAFREALVPYLFREAEYARNAHLPLIFPVFLADPDADPESDCFFAGREILACPVFDCGADSVTVRLPCVAADEAYGDAQSDAEGSPACDGGEPVPESGKCARWRLRGHGEPLPAGTVLRIPCAPEDEPVWFRMETAVS